MRFMVEIPKNKALSEVASIECMNAEVFDWLTTHVGIDFDDTDGLGGWDWEIRDDGFAEFYFVDGGHASLFKLTWA